MNITMKQAGKFIVALIATGPAIKVIQFIMSPEFKGFINKFISYITCSN